MISLLITLFNLIGRTAAFTCLFIAFFGDHYDRATFWLTLLLFSFVMDWRWQAKREAEAA